jgi:hypothetical protein
VEVEDEAVAERGESAGVWRTPEVLDDADCVAASGERGGDVAVESGEAVDQRRDAADDAGGIAQGARDGVSAVGPKFQNQDAAHETGREGGGGVGRAGLAEDEEVGVVAAGEIVQEGRGTERSAPGERVRGFGGEQERRGAVSGQSASGLRGTPRRWRAPRRPR